MNRKSAAVALILLLSGCASAPQEESVDFRAASLVRYCIDHGQRAFLRAARASGWTRDGPFYSKTLAAQTIEVSVIGDTCYISSNQLPDGFDQLIEEIERSPSTRYGPFKTVWDNQKALSEDGMIGRFTVLEPAVGKPTVFLNHWPDLTDTRRYLFMVSMRDKPS